MSYSLYSDGTVKDDNDNEVEISDLARRFTDLAGAGGDVSISDILEILDSEGLLIS